MSEHHVAVVGAGCVGCSTAKHLAERSDLDVAVLEKEEGLAAHQSGRNSGVLHPGFNYEPGSLKARFSTEGTRRMKQYCADREIPIEEYGVVVVATDREEERRLATLQERARANGVETEILDRQALHEIEPHAAGRAALHCPEAASVDSRQYVHALARDAAAEGVDFYMGYEVRGVKRRDGGHRLETSKGTVTCEYLVNAAGLQADRLAHAVGVGEEYRVVPFRGEYRELVPDRRHLCSTMIYPTPDPELPFLGVHFTRRADGRVIIGPNAVLAFGREAYDRTDVNLQDLADTLGFGGFWKLLASPRMLGLAAEELQKSYRPERFLEAARRLVPELQASDVVDSYAGVRAQLVSESGELINQPKFVSGHRSTHVLNAVSPGLTSSLPFGDELADRVLAEV